MKVSIITVTYNSERYIENCINSVLAQSYPDIEYIIIDGASRDNTMLIIKRYGGRIHKVLSEKDNGIYDAMNKGITVATGDIIGILNSDDFFPHSDVISRIVQEFNKKDVDMLYGDIAFVNPGREDKIIRMYSGKRFRPSKFRYGYMPPHPSCYIRKSSFEKFGYYKPGYTIAADYELLIRFLYTHSIQAAYIPLTVTYMRTGGVSNASIKSRYVLNQEIVKACKENGISTNIFILSLKYFIKVTEYISPIFKFREK